MVCSEGVAATYGDDGGELGSVTCTAISGGICWKNMWLLYLTVS